MCVCECVCIDVPGCDFVFSSSFFQTLPETAVSSYAASLREKGYLVPALYKVVRENYSDVGALLL